MSIKPEVRHELLTLPAEERQLADELYENLVDESLDPQWEQAWSEEIKQRMKDVADGRVELIDADDVNANCAQSYATGDGEASPISATARDELRRAFAHDVAERPGRGVDLEEADASSAVSSCYLDRHRRGLASKPRSRSVERK